MRLRLRMAVIANISGAPLPDAGSAPLLLTSSACKGGGALVTLTKQFLTAICDDPSGLVKLWQALPPPTDRPSPPRLCATPIPFPLPPHLTAPP